MAQPIFLRNFTLNGVDIGELFTVGTVTIPFLNVERGYYQVGNTDGQHLLNTRIGNTTLTFDGHLITEHTGLSVSETKDLLVAQVMSKEPMQLVFDALPDRYFNVVFEGVQDYDATDLGITPLTLTFSCPEGVAHSIVSDPFRNTQSTSANFLADSEFLTSTFWNEEAYVLPDQRDGSNVLVMDFSDVQIEDMELVINDFVSDEVFYEMEDLTAGAMVTFATRYAVLKPSDLDEDGQSTLEVVIDELDKVNGKVLHSHVTPVPSNGQVSKAYSYSSTGTDRFTKEIPRQNILPNSEEPSFNSYGGSTFTVTNNVAVPEWGATNAVRIKMNTNPATNRIMGTVTVPNSARTIPEQLYVHTMYVKNNGTVQLIIQNSLGKQTTIYPNETRRIELPPTKSSATDGLSAIQFVFQSGQVGELPDFTIWRAKIEMVDNADDTATAWTAMDTETVDNTTPTYVGYSNKDIAPDNAGENLLENSSLKGNITGWTPTNSIYWTATPMSEYTELVKPNATAVRTSLSRKVTYGITKGGTYTVSGEVYLQKEGASGLNSDTELFLRVTYTDGTFQDIKSSLDLTKTDQWQTVVATGTLDTIKPIDQATFFFAVTATSTGRFLVRNFKLETGSVATPWVAYPTERYATYTWYPYGTGLNASSIPLQAFSNTYTIQNDATKVLRLSINMYGNSKVILNRPMLARGNTGTYVKSNKSYLTTVPVTNYGTWKSYPIFEITNEKENGMIGIVNDEGQVLQFGNEENVDATEPVKNETGFYQSWSGSSRPANVVINSGHVSQYPNTGNNPDTPNLVVGGWDFSGKDVVKPAWSNTFKAGAWSGPTLLTNITAPSTGLRTGAFESVERIDFGTDAEKRGRTEIVVLTDANDILMSMTIRDSNQSTNEVIVEYWYGTQRLKSITTDVRKYKNTWFRCTMSRDTTGKKFKWNFENIQTKNDKITPVTKNEFTYNAPQENKASVMKVSRWLLKWADGKATRSVVDKTTYTMESKEVLNIRAGSKTSTKSYGLLPKGVTFETTKRQTGQKIVNNNQWYYVTKNTGKKIPASGWVSGYYLTQTKKVETKKNIQVSAIAKMQFTDSRFTWLGSGKAKQTKNPFKAGDKVVINTYDKTIYVNGVEREDLATIGNQWSGFALESGRHFLRFVNSSWQTNTMEVTVKNQRRYL